MRRLLLTITILALAAFTLLESCSSGKGAFQQGNYYQAVITSANRLRRNDNHKKSVETLRQAYPLGITFYENQVAGAGGAFKWRAIYQSYTYLQSMYNEIQTSPGALKVIPNPKNYSAKLQEARENAAEESYSAGVIALNMGTRDKAKEAHVLFQQVNEYVPGYKDVNQKIQDALWAATVKVLVEPIPAVARTYDVNSEFFNNRMAERLRTANVNEYVAFFTPSEVSARNISPDHTIKFTFDEFTIGQVYLKETQIPMERDSLSKEAKPSNASAVTSDGSVRIIPAVTPPNTNRPTPSQPATPKPVTSQPSTQPVASPQKESPQQPSPTTTPASTVPAQPQTTPPAPVEQPKTPETTTNPQVQNPAPAPVQPTPPASEVKETKPVDSTPVTQPAEEKPKEAEEEKEEKVVICHMPPGNSSNRKAMTIPKSALQAHLGHGDYVGDCKEAEGPTRAEQERLEREKVEKEKQLRDAEEKQKSDAERVKRENEDREKAERERLEKEKAEKEKLAKEKAEKENEDKIKAEREKLEKEKIEKEQLEKEKVEKEKAEKEKLEKEKAEKEKAEKEKKKDNKKDNDQASVVSINHSTLLASISDDNWWVYYSDTSKVVMTYKATVRHFEKTITSKGVIDMKIVDTKSNAVLAQQKVPSEYIWKSEWVTFNGNEEALTPEQIKLSKQREVQPPSQQDLFKQFTDPLLEQLTIKLKEFYSGY